MSDKPSVVLVHGGFVDGSGWQQVYDLLTADGFHVAVVQNPTVSLADDVAVTRRAIEALNGPVVLVGHSYGGAVISEAGTHEQAQGEETDNHTGNSYGAHHRSTSFSAAMRALSRAPPRRLTATDSARVQ